jgi:hypothetical protein
LRSEIKEVVALQPKWQDKNTPEMAHRGTLIRHSIPDLLRSFSAEISSRIAIDPDDLLIEGGDGTGRKTEVPWVRFASAERSPSATLDWYCVYLFDTQGSAAFLALSHGSTVWTGSDFKPRPTSELEALAEWGRDQVAGLIEGRSDIHQTMDLKSRRSNLGPAYESGTACCIRYDSDSIPSDEELKADVLFFAELLGEIYKQASIKQQPASPAPEIIEILEATDRAAGKNKKGGGQGFKLDSVSRKLIENRAMDLAREHLKSLGWDKIRDTSSNKPYDYLCSKTGSSEELYVEVKGTTSDGSSVILTRGEVEHHLQIFPSNALIVVSSIDLEGTNEKTASGGELKFISPWQLEEDQLTPISYVLALSTQEPKGATL